MKIKLTGNLVFIIWITITNTIFAQDRAVNRFPVGEELSYSTWFNFMKVGYSTITIKAIELLDGFPVYHVESITETSPFYGKIYRVNDRFNSWIDLNELFSRRYEKSLREGKYKKDYQAYFDYNEKKAYTSRDTLDIDGKMHDALSVILYVRAENLFPGRIIRLNNFDNDKLRLFNVIVREVELLKVPAGEFQCFVLEPYADDGKLFKNQSKIKIYLSTDSLRLPVMIDNEANFGRMIFKLEKRTVHQ
ncbi:MAG TPA: DUF3108 domain-containing protein [Candidatus Marinimicrobia bacterium]|nr:DUF3108 domain-containing protein [Candidatus Neomarinimicrobiota bacterium]HRS52118.1 DUF3108 domain-containing protein [Candidatus Neomarinimicrobiota bacterium]HRU92505.1 DUF3108 domain-containing protein [Candidatus Neomarinimicrobiota bacterium]